MNTAISPIAQFRSKIEWYLEGNTPNFSSELLADLIVSLKVLASELRASAFNEDELVVEYVTFCEQLKLKSLQDATTLDRTVGFLVKLLANDGLKTIERRAFRDAVVQLILVAESYPEISFRRSVLDLAKSIA